MNKAIQIIWLLAMGLSLTGCKDGSPQSAAEPSTQAPTYKPTPADEEIRRQMEEAKRHPPSYKSWTPPDLSKPYKKVQGDER